MIDGRRVWLVSGQVAYARTPRHRWRDRIMAAKHAGLNTIETPIFWNRHEPRPGKFDFGGENDLRHFVELVGNAGMYCILGFGPYVGEGWDMGGLPPWLGENPNVRFRTSSGPYLEACSRFITTAVDQVRSLQVTSSGAGGPIVLAQCESQWWCGLDPLAESYLGELVRYLREAGLSVPIVNSNNLWAQVEGQIDCWAGNTEMLPSMRQMATVRPGQPRLVIDFDAGVPQVWGKASPEPMSGTAVLRRLSEILSAGSQFNIRPFCGGRNFGFWGGRDAGGPEEFLAVDADRGAVIKASGEAGESLPAVRRITHFASRFSRVFANLDPAFQPVSIDPGVGTEGAPKGRRGGAEKAPAISVVHAAGTQGSVVFAFGPEGGLDEPRRVGLVLPDGSTLPTWIGKQNVAWCLFDVLVSGRSQLEYCNANVFASLGDILVVFAPQGASALLSVNSSPVEVPVPAGDRPEIIAHEGLTIAVLNEDAIDRTFVTDDAVYFGIAGLTTDGAPVSLPGTKTYLRLTPDGKQKNIAADQARAGAPPKLTIGPWQMASTEDYTAGQSARYAAIERPADLASLGCPYGYGWYRLTIDSEGARRLRLGLPHAGDRLHVFHEGEPVALLGLGPGSDGDWASVSLSRGEQRLVILADNLGRFSAGPNIAEKKGVYGEVLEVLPARAGRPRLVRGAPLDVLTFTSPLWGLREGDATSSQRATWTVNSRRKGPLIMRLGSPPAPGIVFLNDSAFAYFDASGPSRFVIPAGELKKGANIVQVAFVNEMAGERELAALMRRVSFSEGVGSVSENAELAFAKWEAPPGSAFGPVHAARTPAWFRCTVSPADPTRPLSIRMGGMSKGQVFVNGKHVCRYFVGTPSGKPVPPQDTYVLPTSYFKPGQANELMIFDEHGKAPTRCRISYA